MKRAAKHQFGDKSYFANETTPTARAILAKIGCFNLHDKTLAAMLLATLDSDEYRGKMTEIIGELSRVLSYDIEILREARELEYQIKQLKGRQLVSERPFFTDNDRINRLN